VHVLFDLIAFFFVIQNFLALRLKSAKTAPGTRAGVVHAIAEKLNLTYTGIYDVAYYEDKDPKGAAEAQS
jgi:hypothetical protein